MDDWTTDPATYSYQYAFRGADYSVGELAQSWEFTDIHTFIIHIHPGIHWQNIAPANGREFVASDVIAHYMRWYNPTAKNYTAGGPHGTPGYWDNVTEWTAIDKYTVKQVWSTSNPQNVFECMMTAGAEVDIECPDAVTQWGDLTDWHHAIGTGPFILNDYVPGSSVTYNRNPNYWGYDERYPQNQLPYINTLKILIIPDDATALAGLRTGKIDDLNGTLLTQARGMQTSNPNIVQIPIQQASQCIKMNTVVKPFNDIKVRQALQMAINVPDIAKSYYLGQANPDPTFLITLPGWTLPYAQWPQDLKDQYTYNPTKAKQLLTDAGYPNGFNTTIILDTGYDMDLWQIVKSEWAAIGINVTVDQVLDQASWINTVMIVAKVPALVANETQTIGLTGNPVMLMSTWIFVQGYISLVQDPNWNLFYPQAKAATSLDQAKQIVIKGQTYLAYQNYCVELAAPMNFCLCQPWLKGFSGQDQALIGNGGSGSGARLAEYGARFWIDQRLKTSMGY